MNKLTIVLLLCASFVFSFAQNTGNKAVIGFYNVENLFDTIDDPLKNDEQFLPGGDYRWNTERYNAKLEAVSSITKSLQDMLKSLAQRTG